MLTVPSPAAVTPTLEPPPWTSILRSGFWAIKASARTSASGCTVVEPANWTWPDRPAGAAGSAGLGVAVGTAAWGAGVAVGAACWLQPTAKRATMTSSAKIQLRRMFLLQKDIW